MPSCFKKKRIVDPKLLREVRSRGCAAAYEGGCFGRVDPHHLRTRGAGGDDVEENLMALCRMHHTVFHQTSASFFAARCWKFLSPKNRVKILMLIKKISEAEAWTLAFAGGPE
jgi:hypothetical protein